LNTFGPQSTITPKMVFTVAATVWCRRKGQKSRLINGICDTSHDLFWSGGAIATASPHRCEGRSFVDLEEGIFHRLPFGRRATKKRQPIVPIPPRLLAHLRRWRAKGIACEHFVEWNGRPVQAFKTGSDGCPIGQVLGQGQMLDRVYSHNRPDHLQTAVHFMGLPVAVKIGQRGF
jgi:hypothetical protein